MNLLLVVLCVIMVSGVMFVGCDKYGEDDDYNDETIVFSVESADYDDDDDMSYFDPACDLFNEPFYELSPYDQQVTICVCGDGTGVAHDYFDEAWQYCYNNGENDYDVEFYCEGFLDCLQDGAEKLDINERVLKDHRGIIDGYLFMYASAVTSDGNDILLRNDNLHKFTVLGRKIINLCESTYDEDSCTEIYSSLLDMAMSMVAYMDTQASNSKQQFC